MPINPKSKKNLKPFKKGQSGNPAGKIPGTKNFTTALKHLLQEDPEGFKKGAKAMLKSMNRGNVGMTQIVLDRIDGPTKKKMDLSIYSDAFNDEERQKMLDLIERVHPDYNHD